VEQEDNGNIKSADPLEIKFLETRSINPLDLRQDLYEQCHNPWVYEEVPMTKYWTSGKIVEGGYRTTLSLANEESAVVEHYKNGFYKYVERSITTVAYKYVQEGSKVVKVPCDFYDVDADLLEEEATFDTSIDGTCAWSELPANVILKDEVTAEQEDMIAFREQRTPLSQKQIEKRILKLSNYFQSKLNERCSISKKFDVPASAFYTVDLIFPASRHFDIVRANKLAKELDRAVLQDLEREGRKWTIWPEEGGAWPEFSVKFPEHILMHLSKVKDPEYRRKCVLESKRGFIADRWPSLKFS